MIEMCKVIVITQYIILTINQVTIIEVMPSQNIMIARIGHNHPLDNSVVLVWI